MQKYRFWSVILLNVGGILRTTFDTLQYKILKQINHTRIVLEITTHQKWVKLDIGGIIDVESELQDRACLVLHGSTILQEKDLFLKLPDETEEQMYPQKEWKFLCTVREEQWNWTSSDGRNDKIEGLQVLLQICENGKHRNIWTVCPRWLWWWSWWMCRYHYIMNSYMRQRRQSQSIGWQEDSDHLPDCMAHSGIFMNSLQRLAWMPIFQNQLIWRRWKDNKHKSLLQRRRGGAPKHGMLIMLIKIINILAAVLDQVSAPGIFHGYEERGKRWILTQIDRQFGVKFISPVFLIIMSPDLFVFRLFRILTSIPHYLN